MKRIKRIMYITFAACAMLSVLCVNALAADTSSIPVIPGFVCDVFADKEIIKNGNYNEVFIVDGYITYAHSPEAADPTPHADYPSQKSSIVVTASDVWRETSSQQGYTVYRANGYVTAEQYHYSRAELHFSFGDSTGELVGQKVYGYGQVDSQTDYTPITGGVAKIFYGV